MAHRARAGAGRRRSIDVGVGVNYVAFGAGAAWAANYVDGTVSRVDPGTTKVTAQSPIGAAQALAAGAGSAWVSTAGGTAAGTLPDGRLRRARSGGRTPDVLIVSDLPLQGAWRGARAAMADAIRLVLEHDFRAGSFNVGYRSCDDSTAQTGDFENRRCAANANAYARADKLVAVIGPFNSYCAEVEIPILNRAPGGPLAMISPTNTYAGLTRSAARAPADGYRDEPDVYYPTGERNYIRLRPGDDLTAPRMPCSPSSSGSPSVYVLDDGSGLLEGLLRTRSAAPRSGSVCAIAGSATFDPSGQELRRARRQGRALRSAGRGARRRPVRRRRSAPEGPARPAGRAASRSWAASASRFDPAC